MQYQNLKLDWYCIPVDAIVASKPSGWANTQPLCSCLVWIYSRWITCNYKQTTIKMLLKLCVNGVCQCITVTFRLKSMNMYNSNQCIILSSILQKAYYQKSFFWPTKVLFVLTTSVSHTFYIHRYGCTSVHPSVRVLNIECVRHLLLCYVTLEWRQKEMQ